MPLYSNWDHNDPMHQPSAADLLTWPVTCGGRIMAACNAGAFNPATLVGMASIVAEFSNVGWVWNPAQGGRGDGAGRGWLDRVNAGSGECGWVGYALQELLMTPAPYGFGIQRGQGASPAARVYDGALGGWGFIANHLGVHHGLTANVCDPTTPLVLSPLYFWGDHVVVEYLGRFWDPSYNTSYATLAGMAAYSVVSTDVRLASGDVSFQMQPALPGPNVWFKFITAAEVPAYNPACRRIGPYAANPLPPLPVVAVPPPTKCCDCVVM